MARMRQGDAGGRARWTILYYTTAGGEQPARRFLDTLTEEQYPRHRRDALMLLELIGQHGNRLPGDRSLPLGGGLFELRGYQIRLFYVFRPNRRVVLLYGVIKKTDAIPKDELDLARRYQRDLEKRE